jgi:hypothetical protein
VPWGPEGVFGVVEPVTWVEKHAALESHPTKKILGLWRKAYGQELPSQEAEVRVKGPVFSIQIAERASIAMRDVKGVDEALLRKI